MEPEEIERIERMASENAISVQITEALGGGWKCVSCDAGAPSGPHGWPPDPFPHTDGCVTQLPAMVSRIVGAVREARSEAADWHAAAVQQCGICGLTHQAAIYDGEGKRGFAECYYYKTLAQEREKRERAEVRVAELEDWKARTLELSNCGGDGYACLPQCVKHTVLELQSKLAAAEAERDALEVRGQEDAKTKAQLRGDIDSLCRERDEARANHQATERELLDVEKNLDSLQERFAKSEAALAEVRRVIDDATGFGSETDDLVHELREILSRHGVGSGK